MIPLGKDFYLQNSLQMAPELIGKLLCRNLHGGVLKLRITETESYYGFSDTASHAHWGMTRRNRPMFLQGGITYIYLCYGLHNMLNIVSGADKHPEAVLIRGLEQYNGPGKLTKALKITRSLNAISLCNNDELWIEDDGVKLPFIATPRIGIAYASDEYKEKLWRFVAKPL